MIAVVKIYPAKRERGEFLGPVDVTKYLVGNSAIGDVRRTVDSTDYEVGVFSFNSVKIKLFNREGIFSEGDIDSIFPFDRDGSKVEVSVRDSSGETLIFTGAINDDATREDILDEVVTITVVSPDSILSTDRIPFRTVEDGANYKEALLSILDRSPINRVLNIDEGRIDLDYDGTIEDGSAFEGKTAHEAINSILVAANSVLLVDKESNLTIGIRTRVDPQHKRFYGPTEELGRRPKVLSVKHVNSGRHRMINSAVVNGHESLDRPLAGYFGVKRKIANFDFIKTERSAREVGLNLIDRYRYPKKEMVITVPIKEAADMDLFSFLALDYPKKIVAPAGGVSKIGSAKIGEAKLSERRGPFFSNGNFAYFVYEKKDRLSDFTTEMKIKEFGKTPADVTIYERPNTIGTAKIGESVLG